MLESLPGLLWVYHLVLLGFVDIGDIMIKLHALWIAKCEYYQNSPHGSHIGLQSGGYFGECKGALEGERLCRGSSE